MSFLNFLWGVLGVLVFWDVLGSGSSFSSSDEMVSFLLGCCVGLARVVFLGLDFSGGLSSLMLVSGRGVNLGNSLFGEFCEFWDPEEEETTALGLLVLSIIGLLSLEELEIV